MAEFRSLAQQYDCLLLDLDGTVFRGHSATEGAVESLARVEARTLFVTNNASRSASEVATHLGDLGFTAGPDDVVTSAQSAARLLAGQLPAGTKVLVIGTDALAGEITSAGLVPVRRFEDRPGAVVQGLSMVVGWPELAEAALAIRAGAVWVATNIDATLPTERGLLPGNGALVALLCTATGAAPQVAGKPGPQLLNDAVARGRSRSPLVVGDRLDTDIEGASAAGLPSLMVLTGVNSARDAVYAEPARRPTFIGHDLRSLHRDPAGLAVGPQPGWRVEVAGQRAMVWATGDEQGDDLAVVRAVAAAVWSLDAPVAIEAGDQRARDALARWSLLQAG
ncbi:HAD-IIA family hydrolase [Mycobacterium sp.]|uniref:HAD-IIA family hydrolase n=1 Tax=Mycobacterium sp. TaxID=1785 RepID=UPI003A854C97